MANRDAPFGLQPVRYYNGSAWNGAVKPYYVPASDNTAIFIGDPITHVGDSNDNEVLGYAPGTLMEVTRTTVGDGNAITGVVVGVQMVTAESTIYRAASTERVLFVCDDPNVVYRIQSDGGSVGADTVGLNAVLIATHAGVAATGLSGIELDTTSDVPAADASNQLLILAFSALSEGNEIGAFAQFDVLITNHTMAQNALGIA
jgi:hypothetical protein